jgi:hypothetical protein
MSLLKLKNPRDAVLLTLGILVLVFIVLSTAWRFRHIPPTKAQVENELAEIAAPPGAVLLSHVDAYKWTDGNVGNHYQSNLTYDQIRAHYDAELARHGWTFRKRVPLSSRGKDLGESQTCYQRGNQGVDIYFTGNSGVGYSYALNVTWGSDYCQ